MMKKLRVLGVIVSLVGILSMVVVATGCASSRSSRSTGTYLDDKTISAKVKTELYADPNVKGTQVDVTTYEGTTQLSGFVENQAQKDRAAEIARRVQGVQMVKNDIIVRPSSLPSTASRTNRIQEPAGSPAPRVTTPQEAAPVTAPPQGEVPAPAQRYEQQPQSQPQPAPAPVTPPASPAQPDSSSQY